MKNLILAYCPRCNDLMKYDICEETVQEEYRGEKIQFTFKVGRCKCCGEEVATDIEYNFRKSQEKIEAYKRKKGIITLSEINEILKKYNIGKEALAIISGFGKITIKRYYDGVVPTRKNSDALQKILNDETFFMKQVEEKKDELTEVAYSKIKKRYEELQKINNSKISQIANYIIVHLGEVTPVVLQILMNFSEGVNYALNGMQLIDEKCQLGEEGPIYPEIYSKYKRYSYKIINDGICGEHGWTVSKISEKEKEAIDLVLDTFGLYSTKILKMISYLQMPWIEKTVNDLETETAEKEIDDLSVKNYYVEQELNSKENIMNYITRCICSYQK